MLVLHFTLMRQIPLPKTGYGRHFKFLKDTFIPLPPLPEQRRIAAILEQADELRQLRREAGEKAEKLLPALFDEMFGEINSSWKEVKLGDVIAYLQPGKSISANLSQQKKGNVGCF
ncbi:MAG: restriction endonuclease subunit S [Blastocatellia bacterium]|nr:restriction endonuclease subunit S [Blastocatellia bacterium]